MQYVLLKLSQTSDYGSWAREIFFLRPLILAETLTG